MKNRYLLPAILAANFWSFVALAQRPVEMSSVPALQVTREVGAARELKLETGQRCE